MGDHDEVPTEYDSALIFADVDSTEEAAQHRRELDQKASRSDIYDGDPAQLLDDIDDFLKRFVAYPSDHARVAIDNRFGTVKCRLFAADHDCQRAIFGAGLPAGNRCIEKTKITNLGP